MLKKLSKRLVALFERIPVGDRFHLSYGDYLDWKRLNQVFSSLDAYRPERLTLKTPSSPEEVSAARVSDGFFRTLGVSPILGRDFRSGEDLLNAPQTAILSYETWQKRFAANREVIGQSITLDGVPSLIIGVLPSWFHFAPVASAGFWTTLHWQDPNTRDGAPYYGVARLKDGVSVATAYADLSSIAHQIAIDYPHTNRDRTATVIPLADAVVGDVRPTLVALLMGAFLLSLIGFVDVSSLLLVRAESRRREIAVRGALGATRTRLVRQFAVEGFLLAGAGCILGLTLTFCSLNVLIRQIPSTLLEKMPYLQGLHFNPHLLYFALMASVAGGILFTLGPAMQLFMSDIQKGLMEGGRTAAGRSWRRAGASLVVIELAVTVMLLVSAGLLAKSVYRLLHEEIGISADHLAVLHILGQYDWADPHSIAVEKQIRRAMAALPGVTSVGESEQPVLESGEGYTHTFAHFRVIGRTYLGEGDEADDHAVSVGYFETLRARLLHGRYFSDEDDASKPLVALINSTMARQVFPNEDPLGKTIVNKFDKDHPLKVVGVVDDIKDGPLDTERTPAVYMPMNQNPTNDFYVTMRTSQPPASLGRSMLFGVSPWDPGTMLAVMCVLAAATLLASYLPARRAASINPTEALRAE